MIFFDIIILLAFSFFKKKESISFDKDNSAFLKAILPFFIIWNHTIPDGGHGTYWVGLFFFISGYGLECKRLSVNKMQWGGRFLKIIIPLILPLTAYIVIRELTAGFSFNDVIQSLKRYELILPHTWFIITILTLYIFFIIASKLSQKYFLPIIAVIITIYIAVLYVLKVESSLYSSEYGFLAGILFYHIEPYLQKYMKQLWIGLVLLCISLIFYEVIPPFEMFYNMWLFALAVAVLLTTVITKNGIIKFFSEISYEVYLCQAVGNALACMLTNNVIYVFIITSCISVIMAIVFHKLTDRFFYI